MKTKIDAMRIREIMSKCFFDEVPKVGTKVICIYGIMNRFVFDTDKVSKFEDEIIVMLDELNEGIKESKGGGISLIMIPIDKYGNQWGEQKKRR